MDDEAVLYRIWTWSQTWKETNLYLNENVFMHLALNKS